MDVNAIKDIKSLEVLFTLLPGLVTFLVVRYLTARERKIEATEAILQGLAYTLCVHAIWAVLTKVGNFIPTPDIIGLPVSAAILGVALSILTNQGLFYKYFRLVGITSEASWPNCWESTFREFSRRDRSKYVLLELNDKRRIQGWLMSYSYSQEKGHICIDKGNWISVSAGETKKTPVNGWCLINAEDVNYIIFLDPVGI